MFCCISASLLSLLVLFVFVYPGSCVADSSDVHHSILNSLMELPLSPSHLYIDDSDRSATYYYISLSSMIVKASVALEILAEYPIAEDVRIGGMIVVSSQYLYYTDSENHCIIQLDLATRQIVDQWFHLVYSPQSIVVNSRGELLVADSGNQRIMKISSSGQVLQSYTTSFPALSRPSAVSVNLYDGSDDIWVADQYNHRLVRFDHEHGTVLQIIHSPKHTWRKLAGLSIAADNRLYVVDQQENALYVVDPARQQPEMITQLNTSIRTVKGESVLIKPTDIYVAKSGILGLTGSRQNRVALWNVANITAVRQREDEADADSSSSSLSSSSPLIELIGSAAAATCSNAYGLNISALFPNLYQFVQGPDKYYLQPCGATQICPKAKGTMLCQTDQYSNQFSLGVYDETRTTWLLAGVSMFVPKSGTYCDAIKDYRSLTLLFLCDPNAAVPTFFDVYETSTCVYTAMLTSRRMCTSVMDYRQLYNSLDLFMARLNKDTNKQQKEEGEREEREEEEDQTLLTPETKIY